MHIWSNRVGQNFQRIDQPRARAAKIGGAVDDVDPPAANARQLLPTGIASKDRQVGERPLDVVTAAGDEHYPGSGRDHLLPIERVRALASDADNFLSASKSHKFRPPVTARKRRVDPFENNHTRASFNHFRTRRYRGDTRL